MLEKLAIYLLGLEPECYHTASQQEKSYINWVLFSFAAVLASCLAAMFVIGLFVSGSQIIALLIMLLGTFVFVSIFRFSLILIKPELTFLVKFNQTVLQTTWKEKWQQTLTGLKSWRAYLKTIRWKPDVAIPGFTLVFRLFYMGLLAFVLVFPITTIFHWQRTMSYNQELRDKALQVYTKGLTEQRTLLAFESDFSTAKKLSWYEDKVSNEYFTMQLFKHASTYPEFKLMIWFVCIILFLPHFFLFRMMRKKEFVYQAAVQERFKQLIESNYSELEKSAKEVLSKYNDLFEPENHLKFLQKGNPYQEKDEPLMRENISFKDLQNQINTLNPTA